PPALGPETAADSRMVRMNQLLDLPFPCARHLRLLLTLDRGASVARAVGEAVRSGDRGLDAGTGTGVLARLALRAGAAAVTAVDREHIALARAIAETNGVVDEIRFVEADLRTIGPVTVGDGYDVLLAFIYTNHPIGDDDRSRLVFDLRDRLGAAGCRVVPDGL